MPQPNRRDVLRHASATAFGIVAATAARTYAANERIRLGLIGCGGRGMSFADAIPDVGYVCDPDPVRLAAAARRFGVPAAGAVDDLRRVLDDKSIDAVFVTTPDHWHAPASVLACQAGKHVYVEKPCSHNLRESRLLLDAARRHQVVVQHGTQSRSSELISGAVQMLREGIIGDVMVAKAWNIQRRGNIGHGSPSDPPAGVDYDAWIGPAEFMPYQSNRFHYNWHWWHNFGTGDIGNDGTHEIDYARWGLGVEGLPTTVAGLGGKYHFDDDQQFPDTATCAFEWPGDGQPGSRRQLIFEMRLWSTNYPYNVDSGAEFYGTKGRMFISKRGKLEVYAERDKRMDNPQPKSPPVIAESHHKDFFDAIRHNRRPNADIQIGHDSVALVHLANVAVRVGRSLKVDLDREQIVGDEQANQLLSRTYRKEGHWAIPEDV